MVRWMCGLVLAMLLLLPGRLDSMSDEDEVEEQGDVADDNNDDKVEDGDDSQSDKLELMGGRLDPALIPTLTTGPAITRTSKKIHLECYVCAYKSETPLRACLDPTKYRVHTIACHNLDDKCFTSVISKGDYYEGVVRGCMSGCVGTTETTCCQLNRCNNKAFPMPVISPRVFSTNSTKNIKPIPPNIVFFLTVLLVLQTVVKVTLV